MSDSPLDIKVVYDASGNRTGKRVSIAAKTPSKKKKQKQDDPKASEASTVAELVTATSAGDATAPVAPMTDSGISLGSPAATTAPKPERTTRRRAVSHGGSAGVNRKMAITLGFMTILAAAGLVIETWWHADKYFLAPALILKTPVEGIDVQQVAAAWGIAGANELENAPNESNPEPEPLITGMAARNTIVATAYGWLGISTVSCMMLMLAAGTGFGQIGGTGVRRLGAVLAVLALGGLAALAVMEWREYATAYPPDHMRVGLAGIVGIFLLLGVAIGKHARHHYRRAAVALLLAAICTVIGLCIGGLCGAVEPKYRTIEFLGMVFVAHSLWAWILLIFSRRIET